MDPTKFEIDAYYDGWNVKHPDRPNRVWFVSHEVIEDGPDHDWWAAVMEIARREREAG
jgi:hypothetical protein